MPPTNQHLARLRKPTFPTPHFLCTFNQHAGYQSNENLSIVFTKGMSSNLRYDVLGKFRVESAGNNNCSALHILCADPFNRKSYAPWHWDPLHPFGECYVQHNTQNLKMHRLGLGHETVTHKQHTRVLATRKTWANVIITTEAARVVRASVRSRSRARACQEAAPQVQCSWNALLFVLSVSSKTVPTFSKPRPFSKPRSFSLTYLLLWTSGLRVRAYWWYVVDFSKCSKPELCIFQGCNDCVEQRIQHLHRFDWRGHRSRVFQRCLVIWYCNGNVDRNWPQRESAWDPIWCYRCVFHVVWVHRDDLFFSTRRHGPWQRLFKLNHEQFASFSPPKIISMHRCPHAHAFIAGWYVPHSIP